MMVCIMSVCMFGSFLNKLKINVKPENVTHFIYSEDDRQQKQQVSCSSATPISLSFLKR